jgi:serine/threonine protein phosphatase PrpC
MVFSETKSSDASLHGFLDDLVDVQVDEDYGISRVSSGSYDSDYSDEEFGTETESLTGSVDLQMALSPLSIDGGGVNAASSCRAAAAPPLPPVKSVQASRPAVGIAKSQGPRQTMEDRVVAVPCAEQGILCAIYDGHGGDATSQRLCNELHERVLAHSQFAEGNMVNALVGAFEEQEAALESAARCRLQTNRPSLTRTRAFRASGRASIVANDLIRSGSTATVVLVNANHSAAESAAAAAVFPSSKARSCGVVDAGNVANGATKQLHVCWLGDSRAVLARGTKAVELTRDHRASDPSERKRVTDAGGVVDIAGRLFGDLALSRGFGNFFHKWNNTSNNSVENENENDIANINKRADDGAGARALAVDRCCGALSAVPETTTVDLTPEDEFVCVASDGVWDTLSNQQVVDCIRSHLAGERSGNDLTGVCGAGAGAGGSEVSDRCARAASAVVRLALDNGVKDNLSIAIVELSSY